MRAKLGMAGMLGAVLIAAGGFGWKAGRARRAAEAERAAWRASEVAMRAEMDGARERLATAQRDLAGLTKASSALSQRGATSYRAVAEGAKPSEPTKPLRTLSDIVAGDAKVEVFMLRWQRGVVLLEYGPFFRSQGISPEKVVKFHENWAKRAEQDTDLRAVGRTQDEAGRRTVAEMKRKVQADYDAAQAELLGVEGYRLMREFESTLPVRNVVVLGLAGATALDGVPITAQQGEQLFQAALTAGGGGTNADPIQAVKAINWTVLDEQARGILSPAQFEIFRQMAVPAGFGSRWKFELDTAAQRAQEAEAAVARTRAPGR